VAVILWLTYETIGVSTFAGLGSIFAVLPGMIYSTGKTLGLHGRRLKLADLRVKLTNEIMQGVRVVKFYVSHFAIPFLSIHPSIHHHHIMLIIVMLYG
jgi:hypothetical protein